MRAAICQQHVDVAHDHRPLGHDADRRVGVAAGLEAAAGEGVAAFDRLIGIGGGAERDLLAGPRRPGQLAPQHRDEVRLHEDDRGEVVAGAELELVLVAPGEAVVAAVGAAAVRVQRPAERHALDAVQRRAAMDLLVGGVVGALHRVGQRRDAAVLHQGGDVARGRTGVAEVEQRRESGLGHAIRTISPFVRPVKGVAARRRSRRAGAHFCSPVVEQGCRGSRRDSTPGSSRCRQ